MDLMTTKMGATAVSGALISVAIPCNGGTARALGTGLPTFAPSAAIRVRAHNAPQDRLARHNSTTNVAGADHPPRENPL